MDRFLLNMSDIILGAVQFGVDYGISNTLGKTNNVEVENILKYAFEHNINTLDVATSYGSAESVIGDSIRSQDNGKYWNVITKTPYFKDDNIGYKQIDELLINFELSRKKIGKGVNYSLLIHNCDDVFLPGGDRLLQTMERLKKEGVISKIGISVYNGDQIDRILDSYPIDIVQLPVNILDQRLIDSNKLSKLKKHGVEIHARSVFLQGLLLMPVNDIPSWFDPIKKTLKMLNDEASRRNMSTMQLAINFVRSICEVDKIVIGVNTLDHFREIIDTKKVKINIDEFNCLSINDPKFVNPSNWKI
jgi:aryl-alcohol dehydrogenase-like predicted oxidoreductase